MAIINILTNQTANTTGSTPVFFDGFSGADLHLQITGTATVQLQFNIGNESEEVAYPNADWVNVGDPMTASQSVRVELARRKMIRAVVTGASGANINMFLHY